MSSTLLFLVWAFCVCCAAWILAEIILRLPNIPKLAVKLYRRSLSAIARKTGRETVKTGWRWRVRKGGHYTGQRRWFIRRAIYRFAQNGLWKSHTGERWC